MKLNVGCGACKLSGYVNIDIAKTPAAEVIADCANLPYKLGTIDEIASYHLIEHFDEIEGQKLINYWKTLLKPGGKIILECPNIVGMAKRFLMKYKKDKVPSPGYLFGNNSKVGREGIANDDHKWGYTQNSLKRALRIAGFESIVTGEGTDYHAKGLKYKLGMFVRAEAIKPKI